ncbi:MAG: MFS transporter, partial [Gemmatimonadota bacterium]|nr:MFS transporter [Gemmatimonadota bacterium]
WMMGVAAALGLLSLRGAITPALLLLLTFLLGLGASFSFPAWYAAMPEIVPREQIPAAVALNGASFNVARSAGPVLAGVLMARTGPGAVFLVNAASFVGVLYTIWRWRRPPLPVAAKTGFRRQTAEGFRATFGNPVVRAVMVQVSLYGLSAAALWALLPAVARHELRLSGSMYGMLLGCVGAGATAGVLALPRLRALVDVERLPMLGFLGFATTLFVLGSTRALFPIGAALVLAGVSWMTIGTTFISTVQMATSGELQGRVISVYLLVALAGMSLGSVLWGGVASVAGTRAALLAAGAGVLLVIPVAVVVRGRAGGWGEARHL